MSFAKNVPTAMVDLDKPRAIALTLDALNRVSGLIGQPLMQIKLDAEQLVQQIDAWIWAALDDQDRAEISQAEIRSLIHLGNLADLVTTVSSLVTKSIPDPDPNVSPVAAKTLTTGNRDSISNASGRLASTT